MSGGSLPPGFRFHPTDEELVGYYLQRKVQGLQIELEVIPVIDLYKFDPWELPEKSFLPKRDMEWFFFCPRDRKYPNGSRTNRATKAGYWKATGKDRKVVCQSSLTGYRKTLVFYQGRAPLGHRTSWVMHEYRLCDDHSQGSPIFKGGFALCRVLKRNEPTQKANDCPREAMFKRSGSCSRTGDVIPRSYSNQLMSVSIDMSSQESYTFNEGHHSSPVASRDKNTPMAEFDPAPVHTKPASHWISPDLILDSSKEYAQVQESASESFSQLEIPSSKDHGHTSEEREISPSSSYSNLAGEIDYADDFSRFGCMSPYSGNPYYMGFYGNEEIPYEGYDQTGSFQYPSGF